MDPSSSPTPWGLWTLDLTGKNFKWRSAAGKIVLCFSWSMAASGEFTGRVRGSTGNNIILHRKLRTNIVVILIALCLLDSLSWNGFCSSPLTRCISVSMWLIQATNSLPMCKWCYSGINPPPKLLCTSVRLAQTDSSELWRVLLNNQTRSRE